jgi:hypothetical protein
MLPKVLILLRRFRAFFIWWPRLRQPENIGKPRPLNFLERVFLCNVLITGQREKTVRQRVRRQWMLQEKRLPAILAQVPEPRFVFQTDTTLSCDSRKLYQSVCWTKLSKLWVAEIESNCGVSEPFQLSSEEHVKGAIPVLVLSSRSQRKLFPSSRWERRCAGGLIGKLYRQPDSRHSSWGSQVCRCHHGTPAKGERLAAAVRRNDVRFTSESGH